MITALVLALESLLIKEFFVIPDAQSWLALLGYGLFPQVLGWVLISNGLPKSVTSGKAEGMYYEPLKAVFKPFWISP